MSLDLDSMSIHSDAESNEPLLGEIDETSCSKEPLLTVKTANHAKIRTITLLSPYPTALKTPRTPNTPFTELSTFPEQPSSNRTLSWGSAYILIISRVIGSGIFAIPGVIAQSAGSIGVSLLLWLVGAIVAACGLAVSLELGCMLPRSGGEKVYLEFIYDRPKFLASTIIAVQAALLGFTASNCIVFGKYVLHAFDIPVTDLSQRLCAASLIVVVTLIHARFLRGGIIIQNALGWIKIVVVTFMVFAGISVVALKPAKVLQELHHHKQPFSWDHIWKCSEWNFGTLATSFFKVSYAYSGYDNINNVLDEVKQPIRTLKTAAPVAMITIFFFYVLLNITYFIVLPLDDIKSSGELIGALFFERVLGEVVGNRALPVLIALSAAGNVMVTTFAQARINQEIARQGFFPWARLLSSSKPFNTPLGGLLVHLLPSLLVILLPPQGRAYSFVLEVKGYPAQLTAFAICAGLLWLRRRRPDLKRPFRAWTPAVYVPMTLSFALMLAPFFPPAAGKREFAFWYGTYAVVGIGTAVLAVLWWWVWIRVLPHYGGYHFEEESDELDDGTKVTRLVKVGNKGYQKIAADCRGV